MSVYKEEILDHFKNPRNFGELDGFKKRVKQRNSHCGDVIELGVKIKKFKVTNLKYIAEVRFKGEGCAISLAGTSMLTEMIKGKSLKELSSLDEKKILRRIGIPISSARIKCARLGFEAWLKLKGSI